MLSRSITTDVSSTPRSTRESGTRFDALIGGSVEVSPELFAVDGRSCMEELFDGFRSHEAETPQWGEFADWYAIACDDEGLSRVEATHDLSAAVTQFALGDDLTHPSIVARRATPVRKCSSTHADNPLRIQHFRERHALLYARQGRSLDCARLAWCLRRLILHRPRGRSPLAGAISES